jgi:hypothetical protein
LGLGFGLLGELQPRLAGGLVVRLAFGLTVALSLALFLGLPYGGSACLRHLTLRLLLVRNGSVPWHYVDFLTYAVDRNLLHKVGGGYSFIHRLLQEYFAARHMEPSNTTDGDSAVS